MQRSQSAQGTTAAGLEGPEGAPAEAGPGNPPADDAQDNSAEPERHHSGVATAADSVALSGIVGEHQSVTEQAAADAAADVAPAEQAVTAKAEPGDPMGVPGTIENATEEAPVVDIPTSLTDDERRLLDWHWANLEYGCSARLTDVSLAHWNQDEAWGGFGGPHCMVKGGYSSLMDPVAAALDVRQGVVIHQIAYDRDGVKVTSASGTACKAAA